MTQGRSRSRSAARLAAVQALYQHEMEGTPLARLLKEFHEHRLGATIEDEQYAEAEQDFFDDVVIGADARRDEIDELIGGRWPKAGASSGSTGRCARSFAPAPMSCSPAPTSRSAPSSPNMSTSPTPSTTSARAASSTACSTRSPRTARASPRRVDARDRVIERLRRIATDPAARGLPDDARCSTGSSSPTTHCRRRAFPPDDPPASVGWKLVAVNLSRPRRQGRRRRAALAVADHAGDERLGRGIPRAGSRRRAKASARRWSAATRSRLPPGAPRVLGLTAIGRAGAEVPARAGGQPGDALWLVGTLGDSRGGTAALQARSTAASPLVDIYRRPVPLLAAGQLLAPHANAMMDVSDGLLLDARRLARSERLRRRDRP